MNYYYDPILGLQYTYLGNLFEINIEDIPQFDVEQWMSILKQTGIMIIDRTKQPVTERVFNITEYKL
jgi:hypothetical protein